MMSYTPYPEERSRVPGRDSEFTEAINQNMRVPERLSVGVGQRRGREGGEETPPAYSMHIPERLTYADTSDMNPRPLFTPSKPAFFPALGLEPCWESPSAARDGESFYREPLQSPMRRSYSDQGFGKTPPSTPTHLRQGLVLSGHPSSLASTHSSSGRGSGRPAAVRPAGSAREPQEQPVPLPPGPHAPLPSLFSPHSMLETARQLGLQASQRLLQTVSQKYRYSCSERQQQGAAVVQLSAPVLMEQGRKSMESWSLEDEGGAAVEVIVLRRQLMKMSRRLVSLERQNAERKNTEVALFSLLLSACLLNVWLWIRR
ncbi:mitochondrial fission factor-like isoform X2 [Lampris incognitus]|uniref:mitochondrial fission factor-like isoform X2 n=1 Tax=Lampris incognitus TaxID=2546036 RepID=UPI0024B5CAEB|nr:mitochondrial fission factor-like isoform X2 [Lampris incognitus]